MRRTLRHDHHIALGKLACLAALNIFSADLTGADGFWVDDGSTRNERRSATENIDDVCVLLMYLDTARFLASAGMDHVPFASVEQHRSLGKCGINLIFLEVGDLARFSHAEALGGFG